MLSDYDIDMLFVPFVYQKVTLFMLKLIHNDYKVGIMK